MFLGKRTVLLLLNCALFFEFLHPVIRKVNKSCFYVSVDTSIIKKFTIIQQFGKFQNDSKLEKYNCSKIATNHDDFFLPPVQPDIGLLFCGNFVVSWTN